MDLKVLVVDDSALMRKIITEMLNSCPEIEVVGTARNGIDALEKIVKYKPHVVTLDLEMPEMDGITALKFIMQNFPVPVIMLSSLTQRGSEATLEALSLGALDFIPKPSGTISLDLHKVRDELICKIKAAVRARILTPKVELNPVLCQTPKNLKKVPLGMAQKVVAIGSSTGGPRALENILTSLPADLPAGILITQHMPKGFTNSLAERLDRICLLKVKEAENGDLLKAGQVLIAPGDYHLKIDGDRRVQLNRGAPVQHVRPSIDVMMLSLSRIFRNNMVGVVLTGMGKDGTVGMKAIKEAGGRTIVQDKSTSVIFSMPNSVIKEGYADIISPLPLIASKIISCFKAGN